MFSHLRPLHERIERAIRELILPFVLFIDIYYRTEWFYLHTSWGHDLLAIFMGGH